MIYRGIDFKKHNVPYGMSLEIFRKNYYKYKNKLPKSPQSIISHFKYSSHKIVKKYAK